MPRRQTTVRARIMATFGLLVLLVSVVSWLALSSLSSEHARFERFANEVDVRAQVVEQFRTAVDMRSIAMGHLLSVATPEEIEAETAAVKEADGHVKARLQQLRETSAAETGTDEKAKALVEDIARIEGQYSPVVVTVVTATLTDQRDEAGRILDEQCPPLLEALIKATDAYSDYAHIRAAEMIQEANERYARERQVLIVNCALALLVAAVMGPVLGRRYRSSLGTEPSRLSEFASRVAAGDLRAVEGASNAPGNSVLASMAQMQTSLVQLIGQVRTVADGIAMGSRQIAVGNTDLASRTEQQAASLEETVATLEELTSVVRQNSDNAQQASIHAENASHVAQRSSSVVKQVVSTMHDINDSAMKVSEITGVIEGIAFQTNILALNAAVEAARAGEQGRGFAVVAGEVRSLAQRSSVAAKEIKDLIGASVQKVRDGSALATEAGLTMSEVTQAVARVTGIMCDIAAASNEQSRGIEQVNVALTHMDEVTQQNAALVEQAAVASRSLEEQGIRLTDAVASFQVV